jgi:uncharacterized protein (DUF302 family)
MKIKTLLMLVLIVASYALKAQPQTMKQPVVMLENESRYGFDETVEKLNAAIAESGWKVTSTLNLQETMAKNGKEVLPVKVLEVCNAAHAYKILSADQYREVSPMLPCRISVYQKQNGKTYLSRMNAPAFAAMIGGLAGETMTAAFNDTEEVLKAFTKE